METVMWIVAAVIVCLVCGAFVFALIAGGAPADEDRAASVECDHDVADDDWDGDVDSL